MLVPVVQQVEPAQARTLCRAYLPEPHDWHIEPGVLAVGIKVPAAQGTGASAGPLAQVKPTGHGVHTVALTPDDRGGHEVMRTQELELGTLTGTPGLVKPENALHSSPPARHDDGQLLLPSVQQLAPEQTVPFVDRSDTPLPSV